MKAYNEAPLPRLAIIETSEGARLADVATDERRLNEVRAVRKEPANVAKRLPLDDVPLHDQAGERCLW